MTRSANGTGGVVPSGLSARSLTIRFGGHTAVDDFSFDAPTGRITGLIGPNGAGKTTTFNACSGLQRLDAGTVHLDGHAVNGLGPAQRARRGIGRTFQRMELFDSLDVQSNVSIGREAGLAGAKPWRYLRSSRKEDQLAAETAADALAVCGIGHLADKLPPDLSTGQRRLVELARCIAGGFKLMLLDEPSSGLDDKETVRFGEILRELVADQTRGILIVEHDMALVMSCCQYLHVLDFGVHIFEGTPAEVAHSELVRAAYLGSEDVETMVAQAR
jgi:ABC-type branched-subunit amino acid transport system ATPase component